MHAANATDPPASALGGSGGEAGSAYRAGVGAWLACNGLLGIADPALERHGVAGWPTRLTFEANCAVDDIVCTLSGGGRLLIQAKRSAAIREVRETVGQWVAAVKAGELGTEDRLLLATAQPATWVRHLGAGLLRRRDPHAGGLAPEERRSMERLEEILKGQLTTEQTVRLLDAAMVLQLDVEDPAAGQDARHICARLEAGGVGFDHGLRAFSALQHWAQQQSTRRTGGDRDTWLHVLRKADVPLHSDPHGPWLARRQAIDQSLQRWRNSFAQRVGLLPTADLAEGLPPLSVPQLAEGIRVQRPERLVSEDNHGRTSGDRWDHVARRSGYLLLSGLPGTGKSVAVEQLAAVWAAEQGAPVPVLLHLPRLSRWLLAHRGVEATMDTLIDLAVPAHAADREQLVAGLREQAADGAIALLLDGLDECGPHQAIVATALAAFLKRAPEQMAVIVTARPSSETAASVLALEPVVLLPPSNLEQTLQALLEHAARQRCGFAQDRSGWIEQRRRWIHASRDSHPKLWEVPLLGTLMTLLACDHDPRQLPDGESRILTAVVHQALHRWETRRREKPLIPALSGIGDDACLDAYCVLGHALEKRGELPVGEAQDLVVSRLRGHWGASVGAARIAAEQIVLFWDQMGFFCVHGSPPVVRARLRSFTEIAAALWVQHADPRERQRWFDHAVQDQDRHHVLKLAAGLETEYGRQPEFLHKLVDIALTVPVAGILAAQIIQAGGRLDSEHLAALVKALSSWVRNSTEHTSAPAESAEPDRRTSSVSEAQRRFDGAGWQHILALADLPMPPNLRAHRDSIIHGIQGEHAIVAAGLAASTDLDTDGRWNEQAADCLRAVLALPPKPSPRSVVTRHSFSLSPDPPIRMG